MHGADPEEDDEATKGFRIDGFSPETNQLLTGLIEEHPLLRHAYQLWCSLAKHQAQRSANALAFDFFLALLPMLALAGWTATHILLSDPTTFARGGALLGATPAQFRNFLQENMRTLGATEFAPLALGTGLWVSSSAFFTLISVFEESFECRPRGYWRGRWISVGFAVLGLLTFALASSAGVLLTMEGLGIFRAWMHRLGAPWLVRSTLALVGLSTVTAYLALLFRLSMSRPWVRRRVWPGAWAASILGSATSLLLAYYATNIARYALFYGGLAAVVVLMLWLWLWCWAVILGAHINVALEDATRDGSERRSERPSDRADDATARANDGPPKDGA